MSPPPSDRYLQIGDRTLDDLLSALRRHDAGDCRRLLNQWAVEEPEFDPGDEDSWGEPDLRLIDHPLSAWVHREAALHVEAGRFEHALCLVENNRRPLLPADMAARTTVAEKEVP